MPLSFPVTWLIAALKRPARESWIILVFESAGFTGASQNITAQATCQCFFENAGIRFKNPRLPQKLG
ncbi:hypothetical protein X474_02520 [Dethiosulfatarculus sandiegensis]|uniref:Uncharacterized protein n=1 Tax=Dethiosulfatarculus sandiegensis TaxID=1429043 RepID=A0A0D2K202_9BACT|nr:hypothetical protein X474_02520 [Dethiosulfatarculus sandiegensis]